MPEPSNFADFRFWPPTGGRLLAATFRLWHSLVIDRISTLPESWAQHQMQPLVVNQAGSGPVPASLAGGDAVLWNGLGMADNSVADLEEVSTFLVKGSVHNGRLVWVDNPSSGTVTFRSSTQRDQGIQDRFQAVFWAVGAGQMTVQVDDPLQLAQSGSGTRLPLGVPIYAVRRGNLVMIAGTLAA